jgi:hydroxymethylbilane synthase
MSSNLKLRIGTRASALATWQANWVASQLASTGLQVELVPITTQGDISQRDPIGDLGSPGVFTKELQRALLDERIDLAVHSLKDLPTDPVDGLVLAAVPPREVTADVLISRDKKSFESLPAGAKIGTGSLRRRAQLLHWRPDVTMHDIRGNVDTRLRKLRDGQYDAIVLAQAGLRRLGLEAEITEHFATDRVLPAVGQGALGIEARSGDQQTTNALRSLNDPSSRAAVLAERALLHALRGGCLAPIGALAVVDDAGSLQLQAAVLSPDGAERITAAGHATPSKGLELGEQVARELLATGAANLIDMSRRRI